MKGVVIDIYQAEAYVSLQDGRNICVGLAHLPSNIKTGTSINIPMDSTSMTNHKISNGIF
ncbi:hypothetical protein M2651_06620 [Clostridium sp. SYSU_GA19001]|uniref:hypothetical protein n=1 Tax=Clostridium caldaquaticum TaxID=2940653 RepID=UPI002077454F|nr:hypothetical protein [Clostridium caldaquaticum]MCM8710700.1 hypothetical protein [Clostridium caldaquaticum]